MPAFHVLRFNEQHQPVEPMLIRRSPTFGPPAFLPHTRRWTACGTQATIKTVLSRYRNDMNEKLFSDCHCPIERTLQSVGDSWSVLILRDAHSGVRRFDAFRKSLGIAPTMLTKRLATLTEAGLLAKQRYSERPPRDEYVLTEAGRDFLPVLFMLGGWGLKHRAGGKVARFFDAQNGTEIDAVAIDKVTGSPIGSREIRLVMPD